ncbi:DEAD/DEAH box helicase [Flammeovirgaceae bacterium SG7u.111]|nr:DEAD/DEAH box helicase [Flammeovirgaceae bacterium SG7u.132]WPO37762.1 DEAD/DEAH box helicase [Flammeovirgaceae bacterium SG7u.111]
MAKKYGNTWWGQQWLKALQHIDFDNRLPRGRTYANKGAVLDIEIKQNKVSAKVAGSSPRPYKQNIAIHLFSRNEKAVVMKVITENPFILSSLLNKKLPQELFSELEREGIKLFPNSWHDIDASCSCPDWALPCKHLAAVIYIIADAIDRNPFMVFLLHGLDVLDSLQNLGFSEKGKLELPIAQLSELYSENPKNEAYSFDNALIERIDFSTIPENNKDNLLKLLVGNPVFYTSGDFKSFVEHAYKQVGKNAKKALNETYETENELFETEQGSVRLYINNEMFFERLELLEEKKVLFNKLDTLTDSLDKINQAHLLNLHPSVVTLFLANQFYKHLAAKSAFIPELVQTSTNRYSIRWIPALLIPEVKLIFDLLVKLMPFGLVLFEKDKKEFSATKEEQLKMLLALFLNHYQHSYYDYHKIPQSAWNDDVLNAFFHQKTISTLGFEKKELAQSIQQWLQKFYLSEKEWVPVLKVEEQELEDAHFDISLWVQNSKESLGEPVSIRSLFAKAKYDKIRVGIMQDLSLLAEYLPEVKQIISSKGEEHIQLSIEQFTHVLFNAIPALRLLNIQVLLPKSLQKLARPQLSGQVKSVAGKVTGGVSFANMENLLDFEWKVAIGNQLVTADEFRKLLKQTEGLVKLNDQYVLLDEKEIAGILKKLENPPALGDKELLKILLSKDYEGAKASLDAKAQKLLKDLVKFEAVELPKGLKATLRPYQLRGFEWMYKNNKLGFGSLLADDMGLGKTLQVICLLLKMKEEGQLQKHKALMVLPTTLLGNWQREIEKFAPDLQVLIYHGPKRKFTTEGYDVMLTSYGTARSDVKILSKTTWALLGIDEAQNIKNTGTEQTKALKKFKSYNKIALSGTPVENRLSEYWSIFDFTNKGYLNSLAKFKTEFIKSIEIHRDHEKLERFKTMTAPFILRRVKTDKSIIKDLPEKIESNQLCSLTKEQSALYKNVVGQAMKSIETEESIKRLGLVFKLMISLKQICNHPNHFLKKKTIEPDKSGKTQMLLSLLDTIYENGEKTLIFTQYKEMGDLLVKLIKERYNYEPLWLHGGVSRNKRDTMVQDFQGKTYLKTMILSLKAGGTGLNLTAANNVIHYDLWWNPAVENQATDRAYRIGQKKNVMVYRMITQGTFEEKIDAMIQAKKELAELTVSSGENWIGDLSNNELKDIFSLDT